MIEESKSALSHSEMGHSPRDFGSNMAPTPKGAIGINTPKGVIGGMINIPGSTTNASSKGGFDMSGGVNIPQTPAGGVPSLDMDKLMG